MKRFCIILLLALVLTGCKTAHEIRPDTIVDIPLYPTDPPTEFSTEMTEAETEPVTRPPAPEVPNGAATPDEPQTQLPTIPQSYDPSGYTPGRLDRAVADAVNAHRQENGLAALTLDARLCAIASVRAWEAARYWSSNRPDGSTGILVLNEYGYFYIAAAENLCFGTDSPEAIAGMWMDREHTKQKLLMNASVIGVGSYTAPDGTTYVAALIVK